jgi:hypothetical protein
VSTAQKKPRIYITDRDTWRESGWLVASNGTVVAHYDAGLVREHTENVATFNKACPGVVVTENKETADLALVWDRTDWNHTAWSGHQNNLAIYNRDGDVVWTGAYHRMTNAASDACKAVVKAGSAGPKSK